MAGEWLKFDSSLPEKPETLAITAAMGWDDPDLAVGKLMRVFRWFDQHTIDGNAPRVTEALLDRMIGATGFSKAMSDQRWLSINETGLALQNFDRHNGATAKGRALTAKRVAIYRASETSNATGNAPIVTPALAREEKRREEKKEEKGQEIKTRAFALPEDVSPSVFSDWQALRRAKKAPITATAINGIRREAHKAGITLESALAMACERGWTGFKAEWLVDRGGGANGVNKQSSLEARNKAVADSFRGSV